MVLVNAERKPGQVCAAVDGVDVVGERVDLLVVAVVVLNGHFDRQGIAFLLKVERLVVKRRFVLVEMFYKLSDAALVVKLVRALGFFAFILDRDANALVEKGLLSEPLRKFVKAKNGIGQRSARQV